MTDNFKEIGSLFGREGAGAGFAKQTDKESFTYAFAWPEGDTWATLTGYLNLDEQPEEYVRRVLQDGEFRSDWGNPDYDPIGDFRETAGDEYRIPLLKVLLREQLESRYEVANHFSTMNRARVELIPNVIVRLRRVFPTACIRPTVPIGDELLDSISASAVECFRPPPVIFITPILKYRELGDTVLDDVPSHRPHLLEKLRGGGNHGD